MERGPLVDFGVEKDLPSNRFLKVTPAELLGKGTKPELFFHPKGKYNPADKRTVWLENDRGNLYQVKENKETGLPYRSICQRDIEAFNDLTRKERYRQRADVDYQWNVPHSLIESFLDTVSAEKDARDTIRT
jgi:hypothetical protein